MHLPITHILSALFPIHFLCFARGFIPMDSMLLQHLTELLMMGDHLV